MTPDEVVVAVAEAIVRTEYLTWRCKQAAQNIRDQLNKIEIEDNE